MTTDSLPPLLDDSPDDDGDVTRQLPAAERTVTDLQELAGVDPEGTGEIALEDIIESADATRTTKMSALVLRTPPPEPAPAAPRPTPPRPTLQQPSSLAPIALDVLQPSARHSLPSSAEWPIRESTIEIAAAAGIPSRASRMVVFSGAVLGACIVAASVGAMLGYSHTPSSPSAAAGGARAGEVAPAMHTTPRTAVITSAHEEITEAPILVAGKDANARGQFGDFPGPIAPDDPPVVAAAPVAPTPTPVAAPTPIASPSFTPPAPNRSFAPRPVMSSSSAPPTGVLRIPGAAGVLIDGAPHRVVGGAIVVTCGHHSVKAPGHPARSVTVPCGGVTTF